MISDAAAMIIQKIALSRMAIVLLINNPFILAT